MSSNFRNTLKLVIGALWRVTSSNLVHFIGQIRALGPLCTDPSWGWQVALKGPSQREFHRSTAGDTIKPDRFAESSSVRKVHFCLCSNQVPGLLHISYASLWNGQSKNINIPNIFSQYVSRRNSTTPAIWLVSGAGGILPSRTLGIRTIKSTFVNELAVIINPLLFLHFHRQLLINARCEVYMK